MDKAIDTCSTMDPCYDDAKSGEASKGYLNSNCNAKESCAKFAVVDNKSGSGFGPLKNGCILSKFCPAGSPSGIASPGLHEFQDESVAFLQCHDGQKEIPKE